MVRSGLSFHRYVAREGLAIGAAPADGLLGRFRKTIGIHRTPPGAKPEIILTDLVCHCGDIRRPAGLARQVPEATLVTVADTAKVVGFPLQVKKRIAGLRLAATDVDWSTATVPPSRAHWPRSSSSWPGAEHRSRI